MVGGAIANQLWTKEESPYCVTNDVYVSGLLRIREGVEVRFEGNHVFEVGGRIRADGTAEAPIQFHPADATVGWQGLLFRDAVAGSYFVHTIIEGSKNSGVRITNTPPAFTNCVIRGNASPGNGGGILAAVAGPPLVLAHCQIETNVAGPPGSGTIYGGGLFLSGPALISDCDLIGNRTQGSQGAGGGLHVRGRVECTIQDSRIVGNLAGGTSFHWGSGVESQDAQLRLVNCLVASNGVRQAAARGGGLRLAGGDVELRNCVLAGNADYGIAAELVTQLRILNCTIVSSERGGVGDWGGGATCAITNSIVLFNGSAGLLFPTATVRFSNIQERHDGEGNISVSPALCPDNDSLVEGSPCIDAGHPGLEFRDGCRGDEPCSPFARGGPRNDMGAYGGPGGCYWTQPRAEPVIRIAPDNTIGFVGQPVSLGVIATGAEPLTYQWFKKGAPLAGQTNTVLTIASAALSSAGEYYVRVTNPLGEVNSPSVPDMPPVRLGIAQLEARTDGAPGERPRLLIRNGKAGDQCAIYSTSRVPLGETVTVPGTPPEAWELRETITFTASEVGWTDPRVLGAGEARYYGVLPAP